MSYRFIFLAFLVFSKCLMSSTCKEGLRAVVHGEMAELYMATISDSSLRRELEKRVVELASVEGREPKEILDELEASLQTGNTPDKKRVIEERRVKEEEHLDKLYEPYLEHLEGNERKQALAFIRRHADRKSFEWVQFIFQEERLRFPFVFLKKKHKFPYGEGNAQKMQSFGPKDNFAMRRTPETQLQYSLMHIGDENPNPSEFKSGKGVVELEIGNRKIPMKPNHPVESISWTLAKKHATRLKQALPTEHQWEFAARAGSKTDYWWGDDISKLENHAWFWDNAGNGPSRGTQPVAKKIENPFQLYDMYGNVWEWSFGRMDFFCVMRGGSWGSDAQYLRSANRRRVSADSRFRSLGFRLVRPGLLDLKPSYTFTLGADTQILQGGSP